MGIVDRAFRNVMRKVARTALVVALLSLAVATMVSMYTGVESSKANTEQMIVDHNDYLDEMVENSEDQLLQITMSSGRKMGGSGDIETTNSINDDMLETITSYECVTDVYGSIRHPVGDIDFEAMRAQMTGKEPPSGAPAEGGSRKDMASMFDYVVTGVVVDPDLNQKYSIMPTDIVDGSLLNPSDVNKVLIPEDLTGYFTGAGVGDTVEIEGQDFQVKGIFSSSIMSNMIFMNIMDARPIAGLEDGTYNEFTIYVTNITMVDYFAEELSLLYPNVRVSAFKDTGATRVESQTISIQGQIDALEEELDEVELQGNTIIGVSVCSASAIVLFIMLYTVKERTKEIGTLKALGFTKWNIMSQIIVEGVMFGTLGAVFGGLIGFLAAPAFADILLPQSDTVSAQDPSFLILGIFAIIMIVVGALGSTYPAWVAANKSPVEAMRHE